MKYIFLFLLTTAAVGTTLSAEIPDYVQTEIDSLTVQIRELELQRKLLHRELTCIEKQNNSSATDMDRDQVKMQLDQLDGQIKNIEQQKQTLSESYNNESYNNESYK